MANATRQNVYALGLSPEAFARPPRELEGVVPSSGLLLLRSHGFDVDAPTVLVTLSSSVLGAPAAALPTGLTEGLTYFARPTGSSDTFALAATPGGSPIASFADAGEGRFGALIDHGVYLDAAIASASALVESYAIAHKGPINAAILPLVEAIIATRIYVTAHAFGNPVFAKSMAFEPPDFIRKLIDELMRLWISGAPIVGATDVTPDFAEDSAVLVDLDGRGFLEREDARA